MKPMRWAFRACLVVACAMPWSRAASLDFLNIPVTPKQAWCGGMPRSGAEAMDGLWYNPSYLGSLSLPVSFSLGLNFHLGTTLLTGGAAFKLKALSLGLGASGLLMDKMPGELQYAGDSGRLVPTGSIRGTAVAALTIGENAERPQWRLGAGFQLAAETLDTLKQNAQLLQLGTLLTIPIGSKFILGVALDGRGILIGSQASAGFSHQANFDAALTGAIDLTKDLDLAATVEGSWNEVDSFSVKIGLEGRFRKLFYLRVGSRFEANPSFTVGGGLMFSLPGPSALGLDLVGLPGRTGGESVVQVAYSL